jgi:hypothetical protein
MDLPLQPHEVVVPFAHLSSQKMSMVFGKAFFLLR